MGVSPRSAFVCQWRLLAGQAGCVTLRRISFSLHPRAPRHPQVGRDAQRSVPRSVPLHSHQLLEDHEREVVLRVMSAASFLIMFQAYLIAPLIPALALQFHVTAQRVGMLVPGYLLPYGFSTLFYGPLSDRIGRKPVLLGMLGMLIVATFGAASTTTLSALMAWRIAAGLASGGIIPITLALLGDLFSYQERGRAIGWIFGAIAGGMAFGSTLGAILNPIVGWRVELAGIGAAGVVNFGFAWRHRAFLQGRTSQHPPGILAAMRGYLSILQNPRGRSGYGLIFFNAIFQSGVFAWLGVYFSRRYALGDRGIGLALLGYGIPGMLLGPLIGRTADRFGRNIIIPAGLLISALAAAALAPRVPLAAAALIVTALSLGFDMSHPPLAGIITSLDPIRRGQAMGLNAFFLFTGFGLGAVLFQLLLTPTLSMAMLVFAGMEAALAIVACVLLRGERAVRAAAIASDAG
jgi:predicted MFS family arabinose efflux permease